jgi:hypothetical protein
MGDLNVRIGNQRLWKIKGTNGETTIHRNGKKNWQTSDAFKNLEICQHEVIYKFTWQARNTKSGTNYTILNEEMQKWLKTYVSIGVQM